MHEVTKLALQLPWVADLFEFEENDAQSCMLKFAVGPFTHLMKKVISFSSSQYISGNNSTEAIIGDQLGGTVLNSFNVKNITDEIWSP